MLTLVDAEWVRLEAIRRGGTMSAVLNALVVHTPPEAWTHTVLDRHDVPVHFAPATDAWSVFGSARLRGFGRQDVVRSAIAFARKEAA